MAGAEPAGGAAHRLGHLDGARAHDGDRRREHPRRPRRQAAPLPGPRAALRLTVRIAVVDVGTNTTRLYLAEVDRRPGDRRADAHQPRDPARRRGRRQRPARRRRARAGVRGARGVPPADRGRQPGQGGRRDDQRRARRRQRQATSPTTSSSRFGLDAHVLTGDEEAQPHLPRRHRHARRRARTANRRSSSTSAAARPSS